MSRIRTIKPEIWTSEQIILCSPITRLLFIGLWNFCDDAGIHPASYVRVKAEIFPADNFSSEEIKLWVAELLQQKLLREYCIKGEVFWIVTGWDRHQRIDKKTFKFPKPTEYKETLDKSASSLNPVTNISANVPGIAVEESTTIPGVLADSSPPEWKGMERIGMEEDNKTLSNCFPAENNSSADVLNLFTYWKTVMNHPRAKLDKKRQQQIKAALKLGYSVAELKTAIDGAAATPFNCGHNENGQRYDQIDLILRDASHIERFMHNAVHPPVPQTSRTTLASSDYMSGVL